MAKRMSLADELQGALGATPSPAFSGSVVAVDTPASNEDAPSGRHRVVEALCQEAETASERALTSSGQGSGRLADAAQQANRAILEAKEALESRAAGNLKKEVREQVVEQ